MLENQYLDVGSKMNMFNEICPPSSPALNTTPAGRQVFISYRHNDNLDWLGSQLSIRKSAYTGGI